MPALSHSASLDAKLLAICNVAYGIRSTGQYSESSPYFEAAEFLSQPWAIVAGKDGINAALIGEVAEGTVVSCRGTLGFGDEDHTVKQRWLDWMQDGDVFLDSNWFPGVGCHSGFIAALKSLLNSPAWLPLPTDRDVIFCGHSKGGACAMLMALSHWFICRRPTLCVTFGAPRCGGSSLVQMFENSGVSLRRYENAGDVVPHVPFEPRVAAMLTRVLARQLPAADYRSAGQLNFISKFGAIERPISVVEEMKVDAVAVFSLGEALAFGGLPAVIRKHGIGIGRGYCSAVAPHLGG